MIDFDGAMREACNELLWVFEGRDVVREQALEFSKKRDELCWRILNELDNYVLNRLS